VGRWPIDLQPGDALEIVVLVDNVIDALLASNQLARRPASGTRGA
jgi:hypothetical protein